MARRRRSPRTREARATGVKMSISRTAESRRASMKRAEVMEVSPKARRKLREKQLWKVKGKARVRKGKKVLEIK